MHLTEKHEWGRAPFGCKQGCARPGSGMGTTVMITEDALHSIVQDPVSQPSQRILIQLLFCSAFQLEIKKMKKRKAAFQMLKAMQ